MLINSRIYSASQTPDRGLLPPSNKNPSRFHSLVGWRLDCANDKSAAEMLLIHQAGSVRVGEVVRYTVTYTPAADTIRPTPEELYVKIKNTSAIPLRAAYLHGPYTLYTSCYPSTFDPTTKLDQEYTDGAPQFEPYLKAGGSWNASIPVNRNGHQHAANTSVGSIHRKVSWVIEIVSQVVFSGTASVNFELLVGRDKNSVELFSTGGLSTTGSKAAQLSDHWSPKTKGKQVVASKGVYSSSVSLRVDDTTSLWNTPSLPSPDSEHKPVTETGSTHDVSSDINAETSAGANNSANPSKSNALKKKIHLVVLTHGLHSNLGADMLYLKESIDSAARNAREHRKKKSRQKSRNDGHLGQFVSPDRAKNQKHSEIDSESDPESDSDDEQVVVRGFPGNAARTERGIQYLGKRLAKYVLLMTYPDQPYLPSKSANTKLFSGSFASRKNSVEGRPEAHFPPGQLIEELPDCNSHDYRITGISFIGHSLGGLVQTYAIAYIQKHSPGFFDKIKPINFIALATPFLGLSNENPMYVRFALDLGLVGRTGQDLGLSWTAPKMRSGWEAIIGGRGDSMRPQGASNAGSKPLLRILPCGPAHEVLAKFQHRTVYSNVVNDGIVPLRTSCLLFLDWKGLDRVEKARRGNGIVGTMAEWGWAELTGANSKSPRTALPITDLESQNTGEVAEGRPKKDTSTIDISTQRIMTHGNSSDPSGNGQSLNQRQKTELPASESRSKEEAFQSLSHNPLSNLLSIFRPKETTKVSSGSKQTKIYKRSQTLGPFGDSIGATPQSSSYSQAAFIHGHTYDEYGPHTPPRTTFFESASDLLMPPLPPAEFITDPASRPRTIFHDRIYHPEDIPSPPLAVKRRALTFGPSQSRFSRPQSASSDDSPLNSGYSENDTESGLKVEEKIARAYHRDLSWRKVLVRLEPDAHNNIIVRRMFTNAYGWPVVKHLVDTHFGYDSTARTGGFAEKGTERAEPPLNAEVEDKFTTRNSRPNELCQDPTSNSDATGQGGEVLTTCSRNDHERYAKTDTDSKFDVVVDDDDDNYTNDDDDDAHERKVLKGVDRKPSDSQA